MTLNLIDDILNQYPYLNKWIKSINIRKFIEIIDALPLIPYFIVTNKSIKDICNKIIIFIWNIYYSNNMYIYEKNEIGGIISYIITGSIFIWIIKIITLYNINFILYYGYYIILLYLFLCLFQIRRILLIIEKYIKKLEKNNIILNENNINED